MTQDGHAVTAADVREGSEGIGPLAGDSVRAMYGMASGPTAYFASTRNMAGNPSRFGLSILGSRGVIELVTGYLPSVKLLADSSWSPGRSGAKLAGRFQRRRRRSREPIKDGDLHAGNIAAVKDLIEAIEKNRRPKASLYEARAAIEMIVAVFDSHRAGGLVELPLKNRQNPLTMLKN